MRFRRGPFAGLVLVLTALAAAWPARAADCVRASDEVTNGTALRASPATASARLGTLKPGEELPFLGSQAGWYEVQGTDGNAAYVSKRWSQVVACTFPSAAAAAASAPQPQAPGATSNAPVPLLAPGHAVDWWFVFKLNAVIFPGCGHGVARPQSCPFGGTPKSYVEGQQFVYASSENPHVAQGDGCLGTTQQDPVGATYDEIYNGRFHYVVWNDQFYGDPPLTGCPGNCNSPWGHSKGMVAWDDAGDATVLQVTTPSWPGSGNQEHPRKADGNTLGCVSDDNVKYSQHFFALRLNKDDLVKVLRALQNASVATDPTLVQIVDNGGPEDVQSLVGGLGHKSAGATPTIEALSSGVRLISKPSALHVPPWQLVSSLLGSIPLRAATWWANPEIPSTDSAIPIECWDGSLAAPGPVEIATSGAWNGQTFGLKGLVADGNHAKIGVSTDGQTGLAIFGDMNQQGTLTGSTAANGSCKSSQNGRGGLFYVVENADLASDIAALIAGASAPTQ